MSRKSHQTNQGGRPTTPTAAQRWSTTVVPTAAGATDRGSQTTRRAVTDDDVRALAYANWERAGCPTCDGVEYWLQAERELRAK